MASKYELAGYLASLAAILDQQDKSGSVNRSTELGEEYHRVYDELKEIIRNETRKSDDKSHRLDEGRTTLTGGKPRGRS